MLDGGPDPPWVGAILRERGAHCKGLSAVSCAKMAGLIDLPFGLWTQVGRKKHKLNCICQMAPFVDLNGSKEAQVQSYSPGSTDMPDNILRELCKNGRTHRFAVWVVDCDGPQEA